MEVFPAILGLIVLALTYKKFRFTTFAYVAILVHCYILFIGGHYTYAKVPLFDYIKDFLHQDRNNYDKVGHFAQGFVPAIISREILIRNKIINSNGWLNSLTVTICISISVFYEFLEWFVAEATGESADAFLGTQGYVWDTQSDMLFATIGAIVMVLFFSRLHNKAIEQVKR
jgi:putative membrane protein